jgi:hypothetical protein
MFFYLLWWGVGNFTGFGFDLNELGSFLVISFGYIVVVINFSTQIKVFIQIDY